GRQASRDARSSPRRRSGSASESIATILPPLTVNVMIEKAAPCGATIPARILRAAQFHEFVEQLVQWGTQGEVAKVPVMRTQLVAARTVAQALADLATSPGAAAQEAGKIPEIAGPREESLVEMATLFVARRGGPARIEGVTDASDPDAAVYQSGALLPGPGATLAGPTFEE
ncbi:MAG: hypothetical protein QOI43_1052, partial [Gaiellales bacterium]|nr:hypothetical protein [Gaiellales bacterium]